LTAATARTAADHHRELLIANADDLTTDHRAIRQADGVGDDRHHTDAADQRHHQQATNQ